jgi:hypothetical protein
VETILRAALFFHGAVAYMLVFVVLVELWFSDTTEKTMAYTTEKTMAYRIKQIGNNLNLSMAALFLNSFLVACIIGMMLYVPGSILVMIFQIAPSRR